MRGEQRQEGYALIVALAAMAVLMLELSGVFIRLQAVVKTANVHEYELRALYQANAAVEDGISNALANASAVLADPASQNQSGVQIPGDATGDTYDVTYTVSGSTLTIAGTGHAGTITRSMQVALHVGGGGGGQASLQVFKQGIFSNSDLTIGGSSTAISGPTLFANGNIEVLSGFVAVNMVKATGSITGSISGSVYPNQPAMPFPAPDWNRLASEPTTWQHITVPSGTTISGAPNYGGKTIVYVDGDLTLSGVHVSDTVVYAATGNVTVTGNVSGTVAIMAGGDVTIIQGMLSGTLVFAAGTLKCINSVSLPNGIVVAGTFSFGASTQIVTATDYTNDLVANFADVLQLTGSNQITIQGWTTP